MLHTSYAKIWALPVFTKQQQQRDSNNQVLNHFEVAISEYLLGTIYPTWLAVFSDL